MHVGAVPSMPIDATKNKRLVIVVSVETAKDIEALAKRDRRPLSAYVRNVLEDHVAAAKTKDMTDNLSPDGGGGIGIFPPPEL